MKQWRFLMRAALAAVLLALGTVVIAAAQGDSLRVRTDRPDQLYALGDTAEFTVEVGPAGGLRSGTLSYRLSLDGGRRLGEGRLELSQGRAALRAALDEPGFLRLELELAAGRDTLHRVAGCGFAVESIRPTNVLPADFQRFWREGRAELLRIPLEPKVERVPERDRPGMQVYRVSFANVEDTRIYGWLTVPTEGPGPFPAVLSLPGAGVSDVGAAGGFSQAGMIALRINIHGIDNDHAPDWYEELARTTLDGYRHYGNHDPYRFYYRRVVLGAIRALDYLASREDVDSTRLALAGGSQGGALSLLVAGLDPRVKALAANVPAMCDHTGGLFGRPAGWPRMMANGDPETARRTSAYYDAALNAALITVPALVGVGFIDDVCAPTTVYAAYNSLRGPRKIMNYPEMGHSSGPGWDEETVRWIKAAFGRR